ncbi:hypothetical protein OG21DRAFT_1490511 [Imleria badia]|nr:hypothetical protein OG21DRAFT_1490511 [Imleria badia]
MAIKCSLDEWTTGKYESIHFKEDEYKSLYKQHLKTLDYFDDQTKKQGVKSGSQSDVSELLQALLSESRDLDHCLAPSWAAAEWALLPLLRLTQGILPKILQEVFEIRKSNTGVNDDLELSTDMIVLTDDIIKNAIKEFGEETGQSEIEEEPEEQSGWWLKPDEQFEQGGYSEEEIESNEGSMGSE